MSQTTEVAAQATQALKSTHPALRHLNVEGSAEALIISGTVSCYYHKQLAQEALRSLRGNLEVRNHVHVTIG